MHPQLPVRIDAPTERRNPRTRDIDDVPTLEVLRLLNAEDRIPAEAVAAVLPDMARLVDETARRIRAGGRLHYFGAGTSGRLAVMDAAELIPTYSLPPGVVVAHHAGGLRALVEPVEGVEDQESVGAADAAEVGPGDVAVGIAASGRTPYVGGALRAARAAGAFTALVSANPGAELADQVDVHLGVDTGPEAIAGSTRLKAATAHKMVLNNLSTAVMVAQGRTYSNLMVDVAATNDKLRGRVLNIVVEATGLDEDRCGAALAASGGELKTALVGLLADCSPQQAREALETGGGSVRAALRTLA
ncbi:N-acetylmuramic acid 6-phosphate etherase [Streptomyces sp. NBC_01724]|uniref:N-acetylmuramic acid 6-phosphate etherase n=1 Tax=Streptomyces TaxID=1883 RepID=UPI0028C5005E|nr:MULTISPECIES: N-acetylmuramic acid 6-phosphate etherase [unclassified Streptomyces]WTE50206.1 N-acetylmuramic acid 6-phosphate etherase [Streptomyces sp. NBC_01620]WTE58295.1 N-acetylmuramic acid 6-phosphate etherase [Streptomyces sp. NBC_01617]WTI85818.1 N-acetylmuramic acid 6-phosphate etherase [Streptomyces sp. NBC_00724]WNO63333.1 N-acetylmuramic acid 6-phosphate etherase [Streptomyces sp. AM2-3-1]WSC67911.1 N-acetylmuramic acid 6-phosphate etherase [Streptomyces sp. NBC_01760]